MKENMRCSIWFHLLVPGGKCETWICKPVTLARPCRPTFHSRERLALLPPASAMISNCFASGKSYGPCTATKPEYCQWQTRRYHDRFPRSPTLGSVLRHRCHKESPCPTLCPRNHESGFSPVLPAAAILVRRCCSSPPIPSSSCLQR